MQYAAALAIALTTSLVVYLLLDTLFSEQRRVGRRLDNIGSFSATSLAEAEPLAAPFAERVVAPAVARLAGILRSVTPSDYYVRIDKKIVAAGKAQELAPDRVMLVKVVMALVGLVAGAVVALLYRLTFVQGVLASVVVGVLLSFMPDLYLGQLAGERQKRIIRELPDMLDMLMISVQAGLGFDQAVTRYIRYSSGPLGKEFGIALREIQAGKSRREALRGMADRVEVSELRALVMAIVQADVFGVSVSDVLRTQSRELRVRRRQKAEEMAQKAPAKMAFPLIIFVLPATIIVVIAPAMVGIMEIFSTL